MGHVTTIWSVGVLVAWLVDHVHRDMAYAVTVSTYCQAYCISENKTNLPRQIINKKLHGLSPQANYTDRATAACQRSDANF
jgi:hypothetical protein